MSIDIEGNNFELRGCQFRKHGNMYCLTDIWKAAGSPRNKRPATWLRLPSTRQFILQVERDLEKQTKKANPENTPVGDQALALFNAKTPDMQKLHNGNSTQKADMQKLHNGNSTQKADMQSTPLIEAEKGGDQRGGTTYAVFLLAKRYACYLSKEIGFEFEKLVERVEKADITLAASIYDRAGAKAQKWLDQRNKGIATRKQFTAILQAHDVHEKGFADCTNAIYQGLYRKTAKEIAQEQQKHEIELVQKNVPAKRDSTRDRMEFDQLREVDFAEYLAGKRIEKKDTRGNGPCTQESRQAAEQVAKLLEQ